MSLKLIEIFILLLFSTSIVLSEDVKTTIEMENQQLRETFIIEKLEKIEEKLDQIEAKLPKTDDFQEVFAIIEDQKDIIYVMKMTALLSTQLLEFKIFSFCIINRQPFPPLEEQTKEKVLKKEMQELKESVEALQSKIAEFNQGDPFGSFLDMFDDEDGAYNIYKQLMKEDDFNKMKAAVKNTQKQLLEEGKISKNGEFEVVLDLINEQLLEIKQIEEVIGDVEKIPKKSVLSKIMDTHEHSDAAAAKNETSFEEKLSDIFQRVSKKQTIERGMDAFVEVLALLTAKNEYSIDDINLLVESNYLNAFTTFLSNGIEPIIIPVFNVFYKISKFDGGIQALIGAGLLGNYYEIFNIDDDGTSIKGIDLLSRCINELKADEITEFFYKSELLYYFSEALKKDFNELTTVTLETVNKLLSFATKEQIVKLADAETGVTCGLCHVVAKYEDQKIASGASDILLLFYKNSGEYMIDVKYEFLKCGDCGNISEIISDMKQ